MPKTLLEVFGLPTITEKELQATVVEAARALGWIVGFTYDARKSEPGEPDLRMVHPVQHRVIFAELKRMKGKLTKGHWNKAHSRWLPGQDEWGEALAACEGVEYYLWRPDSDYINILRGDGDD